MRYVDWSCVKGNPCIAIVILHKSWLDAQHLQLIPSKNFNLSCTGLLHALRYLANTTFLHTRQDSFYPLIFLKQPLASGSYGDVYKV